MPRYRVKKIYHCDYEVEVEAEDEEAAKDAAMHVHEVYEDERLWDCEVIEEIEEEKPKQAKRKGKST